MMVGFPKPGTIAETGLLKLTGWVWGRGREIRELRVFVDQQDAVFASFEFPVDSWAICNAGFDPGFCDPLGGFRGMVDIHDLEPGLHKLLAVATDMSEDPPPSNLEIEFIVPETFVNHPPVARNDEVIITLIDGTGPETTVDVCSPTISTWTANPSSLPATPLWRIRPRAL